MSKKIILFFCGLLNLSVFSEVEIVLKTKLLNRGLYFEYSILVESPIKIEVFDVALAAPVKDLKIKKKSQELLQRENFRYRAQAIFEIVKLEEHDQKVPSFIVFINDETFKTEPRKLSEISVPQSLPPEKGSEPEVLLPQVEVRLEPATFYVGQKIRAVYQIKIPTSFQNDETEVLKMPLYEGAWKKSSQLEKEFKQLESQTFQWLEEFLIVEKSELTIQLPVLVFKNKQKRYETLNQKLTIKALPLPEAGRVHPQDDIVGDIRIAWEKNKIECWEKEFCEVLLIVAYSDSHEKIEHELRQQLLAIKLWESVRIEKEQGLMPNELILKVLFKVNKGPKVSIPKMSVHYFSLKEKIYKVTQTENLEIEVKSSPIVSLQSQESWLGVFRKPVDGMWIRFIFVIILMALVLLIYQMKFKKVEKKEERVVEEDEVLDLESLWSQVDEKQAYQLLINHVHKHLRQLLQVEKGVVLSQVQIKKELMKTRVLYGEVEKILLFLEALQRKAYQGQGDLSRSGFQQDAKEAKRYLMLIKRQK